MTEKTSQWLKKSINLMNDIGSELHVLLTASENEAAVLAFIW